MTFIVGNAWGQVCNAGGIVVNALTAQPVPHAQVTVGSRGAATDASGRWNVAGIPCGAARFRVARAGYLESTSAPLIPAPDINLKLTPESSVSGKVLDEAGDPVVGAEIQIYSSVVRAGRRVMSVSGSANANSAGEFRVGALSAGRYRFCAHSSKSVWPVGGGEPLLYSESCYPAGPLWIAGGVDLRQNFTLLAVRGVHVRGMVSGLTDGARAVIQLGSAGTRVAGNGKFDLMGVIPGSYTLEGLADLEGRSVMAATRIEVDSSDLDNVVLAFVPGVTVTGAVVGLPEDASVTVNLVPSDPASDAGRAEWDDSQRSFTFPSVAPGKYRLAVRPPSPPYYVKSIQSEGHDISDRELTITSPVSIEIVLGAGLGGVAGMVVDDDGKPVPADVLVLQGNQHPWRGTAQPDGRFTMENLPPGDYQAYAFDDARDAEYAEPGWLENHAGTPVTVTIQAGASADIRLIRRRFDN